MLTYRGSLIFSDARYWMMVPFLPEVVTVVVDVTKKKCVQQPEMGWILRVQVVQTFKSCEKGTPSTNKLRADFNPKPLNTGIASGAVAMTFDKQLIMLSCTLLPAPHEGGTIWTAVSYHPY
jgi:hypothetical protein